MNLETKNFIAEKLNIGFQLKPLTSDAGTRQYFTINNEMNTKYILCVYKKEELTSFDYFLNVNSLFLENYIKTPQILHTSKSLGLMILEDLGNRTLEDDFKDSLNLELYHKALNELIKIQAISPKHDSIAHSYAFTIEKFNWEFNFTLDHLTKLYNLDKISINNTALQAEFNAISKHLFNLPQIITHRDYHSRNIISKNDSVYIIDFQDARMGNPFYDLTSLIEDTYTNLNQSHKKSLLDYYQKNTTLKFESDFNYNYNLQALQRSLKACGSFARLKNLIGTDRYLTYLNPSFLNIKKYLKKLNTYPEIANLVEICSKHEGL